MSLKLAFNTADVPLVVDFLGRSIGGRLWGTVDSTERHAQRALEAGLLIPADEDTLKSSGNPDAVSAVQHVTERRAAIAALQGVSKDDLLDVVPPDVVAALPVGKSGEPSRADLVDAAVATDTAAPKSAPPTKGRTSAAKER